MFVNAESLGPDMQLMMGMSLEKLPQMLNWLSNVAAVQAFNFLKPFIFCA